MHLGLFLVLALTFSALGCARELDWPFDHDASEETIEAAPRYWTWPADGESAAPIPPERLLLASQEKPHAAIVLEALGVSFELSAREIECEGLFPEARFCAELEGDLDALAPGPASLTLGGEAIASLHFIDDLGGALELLKAECGVFEEAHEGGCVDRDDRSAIFRGSFSRSARLEVFERGERIAETLAPGGRFEVELDLRRRCSRELEIVFTDLAGEAGSIALELEPHRDLPELHLIESLADPYGPEPQQEYLVIYNASASPIALDGYRISDSAFRPGDLFPPGATIAPGARALLVSELYDPAFPGEPSPPPAAPLIRFAGSLTANGLANQGEPIYLIDDAGRRVSAMPRVAVPEGSCLIARSIENRRTDLDRFLIGDCQAARAR